MAVETGRIRSEPISSLRPFIGLEALRRWTQLCDSGDTCRRRDSFLAAICPFSFPALSLLYEMPSIQTLDKANEIAAVRVHEKGGSAK